MAKPWRQVLLLGDSLIQRLFELDDGFSMQSKLEADCKRRLDVVNRGLSGWNTNNVLEYFSEIIPAPTDSSPKIEYLLILLGANDAVLPMKGTWQHVPIDQYEENLSKIITHSNVQAHKPRRILLVTPPPLDEIKTTKDDMEVGFPSSIRQAAVSSEYAERARKVAKKHDNVVLIDLYKAVMDEAIKKSPDEYTPDGPLLGTPENGKGGYLTELLPDGLHLSGKAYRLFYDVVQPHIGDGWADYPFVLPDWAEFKPADC